MSVSSFEKNGFPKPEPGPASLSGGAFIILTFDPFLDFDYFHNSPYIGPGIQILHGALPLVGSYCQYGLLQPILYAALFKFAPNWSLHSVGVLNAVMNLAFNFVFFWLIWRVTRNRWVSVLGTLLAVWFHQLQIGLNPSSQPMNIALRFFPDILLLLSLSYLPPQRRFSWHTALALLFGGFFSGEAFIFCVGTLTAFEIAYSLLNREKWTRLLFWAACPLLVVVIEHAFYSGVVHAITHEWPNYQAYKEIFLTQKGGDSVPAPFYFFTWALVFIPYLITFTHLWREREACGTRTPDTNYLFFIFPAAVMGILESLYYVGRSVPLDLVVAMNGFSVLLIASFDLLLRSEWPKKVIGSFGKKAAFICVSVMIFSCWAHLVQPLHECFPNSTLLRRCLSSQGCWPSEIASEWRQKVLEPFLS